MSNEKKAPPTAATVDSRPSSRPEDVTVPSADALAETRPSGEVTAPMRGSATTAPMRQAALSGEWVGTKIDHFQIRKRLGVGGMGSVWEAHDTSLDRSVALKLLPPDVSSTLAERFVREARTQARISHPNVVQVYFVGEQAGQKYFVMERVRGESLHDRIKREGAIPWLDALELAIQCTRGLQQAYGKGLVHRDVKPANIMIQAEGVAKLTDFGIAKPLDLPDPDDSSAGTTSTGAQLTQIGAFIGTPMYAPPEQAKGGEVDHRTDIYALGGTLYHAILGEPCFSGSMYELIQQHDRDLPQMDRLPPDVPRRVRALLARMLAKSPDDRFETYAALLAAMEQAKPYRGADAPIISRVAATALDIGPVALVMATVEPEWWGANAGIPLFSMLAMPLLAVPSILTGRTLGQRVTKLVVLDDHDEPPNAIAHVVRAAGALTGFIAFDLAIVPSSEFTLFFGYYITVLLFSMFSGGHRVPHDIVTNTRVAQEH